jgi:hypothetical protein
MKHSWWFTSFHPIINMQFFFLVFEHLQRIFSINSGYALFRFNLQILLFMYIHQKEAANWLEERLWNPGKD